MKEKNLAKSQTVCTAIIGLFALLGFCLVVYASYPGYLHADNIYQLAQIHYGQAVYTDWQPPFILLLWIGLMEFFPGPVGILLLDNFLIWGGLACLSFWLSKKAGYWALLVFCVPFMPGMLNLMGHANRDILLVAWLIPAFVCAFFAHNESVRGKMRIFLQTGVILFSAAAFLTRSNIIFALTPLWLYAFSLLKWRRNLLVCLTLAILMPVTQSLQNRLMQVERTYPEDSVKTYHLMALSYFEGQNLFPGQWTFEESRRIAEGCYTPNQWETAARWRSWECGMIHENMVQQGIWGSGGLTENWLRAVAGNPAGTYAAMAATFHLSMWSPNSSLILYPPPKDPAVTHWEVDPSRATTRAVRHYMKSWFNRLGKPWVFAFVLAGTIVSLLTLRLANAPLGRFALTITVSGAVYLLTYFPLNVSAEYRYFYWSGFAAWLGLLLFAVAWKARPKEEGQNLPRLLHFSVCAVVAAMVSLVVAPSGLPLEKRAVAIIPQGDAPLLIQSLRMASTPLWKGAFEGTLSSPGWEWEEEGIHSTRTSGTLTTVFEALHQDVRVIFKSGPEGGKARIEDGNRTFFVDTRAKQAGEITIDLPARGNEARWERQGSGLKPLYAAGLFFALMFLFHRLSRPAGHKTSEPSK